MEKGVYLNTAVDVTCTYIIVYMERKSGTSRVWKLEVKDIFMNHTFI